MDKQDTKIRLIFNPEYRRPRKVIRIHIKTGEREEYENVYWAAESIVSTSTEVRLVCDGNVGLEEPKFQRKGYYFIYGD